MLNIIDLMYGRDIVIRDEDEDVQNIVENTEPEQEQEFEEEEKKDEKIPPEKPPKFSMTGSKNLNRINFDLIPCFLFVGKPASGKSNAIKSLILMQTLNKKPLYEFGLVFTGTKFNKDYDYIPSQYLIEGYDEEVLQRFLDVIKVRKQKGEDVPHSFLVIDDMMGLLNNYNSLLTHVITCRRHYNIHIYLACQYVAQGSSTVLRSCVKYAILFATRDQRSLKALYDSFGGLFDKFPEFKEHFFKVTQKKYSAMCYDNYSQHEEEDNYFAIKFPDVSNVDVQLEF